MAPVPALPRVTGEVCVCPSVCPVCFGPRLGDGSLTLGAPQHSPLLGSDLAGPVTRGGGEPGEPEPLHPGAQEGETRGWCAQSSARLWGKVSRQHCRLPQPLSPGGDQQGRHGGHSWLEPLPAPIPVLLLGRGGPDESTQGQHLPVGTRLASCGPGVTVGGRVQA